MGPGLSSSTAVSAEREFCRNAMEALRGSFPGFCFSWTLFVVPRFDAGICTCNELTGRGLLSVLAMSSVDGSLADMPLTCHVIPWESKTAGSLQLMANMDTSAPSARTTGH